MADFEQKFAALAGFPHMRAHESQLRLVKAAIERCSDWELFRINPLRFAAAHGLSDGFAVDFFVHGAKIGLFDLQWSILCPGCSGIEYSVSSIGDIENRGYHCTICSVDVPTTLDDQLEVAFTLNRGVKELKIDPFESFESYRRFFFSSNYERSAELNAYSADNFKGFTLIPADGTGELSYVASAGVAVRALSMVSHSQLRLVAHATAASSSPQVVELELGPTGFLQKQVDLNPGPVQLKIRNRTQATNATTLLGLDQQRLGRIMAEHPNRRLPFLTAKMLLNNQSYKEFFRVQTLPKDFNLRVRSLTLLFTDLKGSTELYERSGDLGAFHLVQEHFKALTAVVRRRSGAIVKTMGDAVMATFSTPAHAVAAALEMMEAMRQLEVGEAHGEPIGLKVGIHEGPTLAVNSDDRIDYFGHTVNLAARVQGQAGSGEVVLTDAVMSDPAVELLLAGRSVTSFVAPLKGIASPVRLFRLTASS